MSSNNQLQFYGLSFEHTFNLSLSQVFESRMAKVQIVNFIMLTELLACTVRTVFHHRLQWLVIFAKLFNYQLAIPGLFRVIKYI